MGTKDAHDPAYSLILEGLIARRKSLGLTQVDLARAIGADQSQISKFERRERRIDIIDFLRLCAALDLDPTKLLADAKLVLAIP